MTTEINLDGLVGMTHFYGGLALGNVASMTHAGQVSNPKQAALQGLEKMFFLHSLGVKQGVIPPHERPYLPSLRQLGFTGNPEAILQTVAKETSWLIPQVTSSSPMWTANAATITPSIDSASNKLNFTPANLVSNYHRSIEKETTAKILKAIFPNPIFFEHHSPLPSNFLFQDEGAANHTRFSKDGNDLGVHLFVYGESRVENFSYAPKKFPSRQTLEASQAVARSHRIYPQNVFFVQQNPEAIDAGCFHNDVISVGHKNVFFVHEKAFINQGSILARLKERFFDLTDTPLIIIEVKENEVSLKDAVETYLFNSQIVTVPDGSMHLIAPSACSDHVSIQALFQKILEDPQNPITTIHYVDLTQSMENGGGPACLRLRVQLNPEELKEMNPHVLMTDELYLTLKKHIEKFYPESLTFKDLQDPALYKRNCEALNELTAILYLGRIYSFQ